MASGNANFEVQVLRGGRWVVESVRDSEEEARALAKKLFAAKDCEGARVIRNWMRPDGKMVEAEICCETRTLRDDAPMRITQVEDAPPRCEAPQEYYGLSSRMVMNRLFRQYLERVTLTPTELIHNYKELRRLQDKDTLVPSAVDRVAVLQTRDSEQDPRQRREEIYKNVDLMSVRARKAEALKLPKINGSFHAVRRRLSEMAEKAEDTDYLALVVLSRDLVNLRNWLGKLDRLCALAVEEDEPDSLHLLDGVIADVLGANVVQEILGWQPSLGHAIMRMFDLADGRLPVEKSDAGASAEMLNRLLGEGKLPASRLCLIDRAHRQLRSANALCRTDPGKEHEVFRQVAGRVLTPSGLLSGAETAEALTTRQTRMVEEGGAPGRRAAIAATVRAMPDRASAAIYLADLAASSYAAEHLPDIVAQLEYVCGTRGLADFCQRELSPKDRMQRATHAFTVVRKSVLADPVKAHACQEIDGILERFLIDNKVVERLDHHESSLRDRAVRLVQFCASGVLPEGRAMARARARILDLLRQPKFDAHFVEGMDPAHAQRALRDFHELLVKAGFGR